MFKMEEMQINMQDVMDNLLARITNDAKNIAILEATIEVYKTELIRVNNVLENIRIEEVRDTGVEA